MGEGDSGLKYPTSGNVKKLIEKITFHANYCNVKLSASNLKTVWSN